jgi:site-specific DNA-cytosine methylase
MGDEVFFDVFSSLKKYMTFENHTVYFDKKGYALIWLNGRPPLRAERGCDRSDTVQIFNGQRIRRLTPIECERLQGLPDDYTKFGRYGEEVKEVSDTQRYKTTGNAMTVNVIEANVSRMIEKGCLG